MNNQQLWKVVRPRLRAQVGARGFPIDVIATFCGVKPDCVERWVRGLFPPQDAAIQLWHLLAIAGVPSPELKQMDPLNYTLGRMFACQVLEMYEVKFLCDISSNDDVTPYAIFRGKELEYPEEVLVHLNESKGDALDRKVDDLREDIEEMRFHHPFHKVRTYESIIRQSY